MSSPRSGWRPARPGTGWSWRPIATWPWCRCSREPTACARREPGSRSAVPRLRIPVGADWLGRVCNGRGEPVDGGPPVTGEVTMPVAGSPINPVLPRAARRAGADRDLGHRLADHAGPRPEAPRVLGGGPAASRTGRAAGRPGIGRRRSLQRRVCGDGPHPRRCRGRPHRARGALGGRRARAAAQPGRRPGHRAHPDARGWPSPWPNAWHSPSAGMCWSSWPT